MRGREAEVIGNLCCFDEFNRFYREEWKPRKKNIPVEWGINPYIFQFFKRCAIQGINRTNGLNIITFSWPPATLIDAFIAAHEIEHVIRKYEKQSLRFGINQVIAKKYGGAEIEALAASMGSMFEDPLIDAFLQNNYGFNPADSYIEISIAISTEILNNLCNPPDNSIHQLENVILYSQQSLQWEIVKDERAKEIWQNYKNLYREKDLKTVNKGEELYSIVNRIGYATLDKQRQIFDEIASMYEIDGIKLKDFIYIID